MALDGEALRRDVEVLIERTLSLEAQKAFFVGLVEEEAAAFEAAWRARLASPSFEADRLVDGRRGAPIAAVNYPGGVVLLRAYPVEEATRRAIELLNAFVKVKSGRLKRSLAVYVAASSSSASDGAGGVRAAAGALGQGAGIVETTLAFLAPYGRKAERRGFNLAGAAGGRGLLATVAQRLKREFADTPLTIRDSFRNVDDVEIGDRAGYRAAERARRGISSKTRKRGVRRALVEPTRVPVIVIN